MAERTPLIMGDILNEINVPDLGGALADLKTKEIETQKDIFAEKERKAWDKSMEARCDFKRMVRLTRRASVFFFSLWQKSLFGRTLTDIKGDEQMVDFFADEISPLIQDIVGEDLNKGDWCVITTPKRRHTVKNFATRISEKIAEKLNKDKIVVTANDCRNIILDLFKELWVDPINKQKELEKSNKNYSSETFSNFLNSYLYSKKLASNGYMRTQFTSMLVSKFIEGITIELNEDCPLLSNIKVDKETEILINILKHFSYVYLINSAMLKVVENRGYEIIKTMFERFTKSEDGYKLLPEDFQFLYFKAPNEAVKKRVICDFIAGMTDRYALEFYGRLFSENPQTIFKPL